MLQNENEASSSNTHQEKGNPKQKCITKIDIGLPYEFRHVSHIGFDANKGFHIKTDDPQMKEFFQKEECETRKSVSAPSTPQPEKKKMKRKNKITKADIGRPSDFRHVSHIGWSADGFNVEGADVVLSKYLSESESYNAEAIPKSSSAPPSLITTASINVLHKQHIQKADIGLPHTFRHLSHIAWDPNRGFTMNCEDPELNAFLKMAGVTDKQLQDQETRDFIFKFINRHGGYEAIQEEVKRLTMEQSGKMSAASSVEEVISVEITN